MLCEKERAINFRDLNKNEKLAKYLEESFVQVLVLIWKNTCATSTSITGTSTTEICVFQRNTKRDP